MVLDPREVWTRLVAEFDVNLPEDLGPRATVSQFGAATPKWLTFFFCLARVLIGSAGWMAGAGVIFFTGVAGAALHAAWQMSLLDIDDSGRCLKLFRSNRDFGLIIFIAAVLDSVFRIST